MHGAVVVKTPHKSYVASKIAYFYTTIIALNSMAGMLFYMYCPCANFTLEPALLIFRLYFLLTLYYAIRQFYLFYWSDLRTSVSSKIKNLTCFHCNTLSSFYTWPLYVPTIIFEELAWGSLCNIVLVDEILWTYEFFAIVYQSRAFLFQLEAIQLLASHDQLVIRYVCPIER